MKLVGSLIVVLILLPIGLSCYGSAIDCGETWDLYQLPNGEMNLQSYAGRINYQDDLGIWRRIDTTIVPSNYGSYNWEVTKGPYNAYFKNPPVAAKPIMVENDGNWITYKAIKMYYSNDLEETDLVSNSQNVIGYPEGNKFIYQEIFGSEVDLEYFYTGDRLVKNIILNNPISAPKIGSEVYLNTEFVFKKSSNILVKINGQKWNGQEIETSDSIEFWSGDELIFYLPKPFAYDSNYSIQDASYIIDTKGINLMITIKVPYSWIDDLERAYPIVIDPTTNLVEAKSLITKDTYIHEYYPNTNYGSQISMLVGRGEISYVPYWQYGYIGYDFSNFSVGIITNASLNMYMSTMTGAMCIEVHDLNNFSWNETNITYNNAPTGWNATAEYSDCFGYFGYEFRYRNWSVTNMLTNSVNSGVQKGTIVMKKSATSANKVAGYITKENTNSSRHPFLNITYTGSWLSIHSPLNENHYFGDSVELNFSSKLSINYNISVDDVFLKTISYTNGTYHTENISFSTSGYHNITVMNSANSSDFRVVKFYVDFVNISNINFISTIYETTENKYNVTINKLPTISLINASVVYGGTRYNLGDLGSNIWGSSITTKLMNTNATNKTIYYDVWANEFGTPVLYSTDNQTQTVNWAYFIDWVYDFPGFYTEGSTVTQDIIVKDYIGNSILQTYLNSTNFTTKIGALTDTTGFNKTYEFSIDLPVVSAITNIDGQNYLEVTAFAETKTRPASAFNITVSPTNIGTCAGNRTQVIVDYTAWNEKDNTQFTSSNNWESEITVIVAGQEKTFGAVTTNGNNHQICIVPNATYTMNITTWLERDLTQYVKRSHFITNWYVNGSTPTQNISIYLLNISDASVIDFYVQDAFGSPIGNRNIKLFKFYPIANSYEELFTLMTDQQGHAVGYLKAYDEWYKIVVTDINGVITKVIPSTQFSTSTYIITEDVSGLWGTLYGINWVFDWNNVTSIASVTISSEDNYQFKLELGEIGLFSNTTICTDIDTGTSLVLYCDLSNSSYEEFVWALYVERTNIEGNSYYDILDSGIVNLPLTPPYGLNGLILAAFMIIFASTLFLRDAKVTILTALIGLTIARVLQFIVVNYGAILGIWAVGLVLVYLLRSDR